MDFFMVGGGVEFYPWTEMTCMLHYFSFYRSVDAEWFAWDNVRGTRVNQASAHTSNYV